MHYRNDETRQYMAGPKRRVEKSKPNILFIGSFALLFFFVGVKYIAPRYMASAPQPTPDEFIPAPAPEYEPVSLGRDRSGLIPFTSEIPQQAIAQTVSSKEPPRDGPIVRPASQSCGRLSCQLLLNSSRTGWAFHPNQEETRWHSIRVGGKVYDIPDHGARDIGGDCYYTLDGVTALSVPCSSFR